MRNYFFLVLALAGLSVYAQEPRRPLPKKAKDSTGFTGGLQAQKPTAKKEAITITDYKIITAERDTTILDTTLTIYKEYRYNYLRKDNFELMPFANVGQPYNSLGVSLAHSGLYPELGARARHFNYLEARDMLYYNVATPLTELFFKTTFEQGQLLDAMLTFNTSPRLNFSIAYKGFRSLGKYQINQAESGNFRTTFNYRSRNSRYRVRGHIAAQDIVGEENGGLLNKEVQFESGDTQFSDRSRIDVVFTNAQNKVLGKRYYLDHEYDLLQKSGDSTGVSSAVTLGHQFSYETKYYQFQQDAANSYFGDAFVATIDDKANLKTMFNQLSLGWKNRILGELRGHVNLYSYNYFFSSILQTPAGTIPNQLKDEEITLGATYRKTISGFQLAGTGNYTLVGGLSDYFFKGEVQYDFGGDNRIEAGLQISSRKPDFNTLLYQSDYENYNWDNTWVFKLEKSNQLWGAVETRKYGTVLASYTGVDNYTYFTSLATAAEIGSGAEQAQIKPFQASGTVGHLKVKYRKEFSLGKWALDNTVMYQAVTQDAAVLNVPDLVTRNTLYFSSDVFKKAMFIRTGITFKYFTEYAMDAYSPLLAEFYVQNEEKLGGFPMLDFFINAKVRQTRIYLKAEHFNSSFTGFNYYSAPNYPYRDFVIRFGLVWNFFS